MTHARAGVEKNTRSAAGHKEERNIMNYDKAIEYIESLARFGSKPGLERIRALTERLGNPQDHLKFIHIAGTNGKGSTSVFIAGILSCAGYSVGLYTSPYLERFNERIRLNGKEIADDELCEYVGRVKEAVDKMVADGLEQPTVFEVITAMAFCIIMKKVRYCGTRSRAGRTPRRHERYF